MRDLLSKMFHFVLLFVPGIGGVCLRGSVGFTASSGIAHERPKRSAPGMRPCATY